MPDLPAEHPAAVRHRVRLKLEGLIDRLVEVLDTLDVPTLDLEDEGEAEPSLASLSGTADQRGVSQLFWSWGDCEDLEVEHDGREPDSDRERDDADLEPTLGAHEGPGGTDWSGFGADDLEPSLGSLADLNQRRWAVWEEVGQ